MGKKTRKKSIILPIFFFLFIVFIAVIIAITQISMDKKEKEEKQQIENSARESIEEFEKLLKDNRETTNNTTVTTYKIVGKIKISKKNLILPILENESQKYFYLQSGKLNNIGNSVIFGNSTMFSELKNIMIGDSIEITDKTGTTITYTVYKNDEIDSSDKSYLNRNVENKKEITLYTMNDDTSKQIVVFAEEK